MMHILSTSEEPAQVSLANRTDLKITLDVSLEADIPVDIRLQATLA